MLLLTLIIHGEDDVAQINDVHLTMYSTNYGHKSIKISTWLKVVEMATKEDFNIQNMVTVQP